MKLTALEDIPLADRTIAKGDDFDVDEGTAKILLAMGKAKEKTLHVRTYRRRDLTAEQ